MAMVSVTASTLLLAFVSLDRIHIQTMRICRWIPMVMDYQTTILTGPALHTLTMMTTTMDSQMRLKRHVARIHSMPTASLPTWTVTPSAMVTILTWTVMVSTTSTKRERQEYRLVPHQPIPTRTATESVTVQHHR